MRTWPGFLVTLLLLFVAGGRCIGAEAGHGQLDSLQRKALDARLEEYFEALKHESLQVQKQECDFLIESCTDSLVRQFVAVKIYGHYISSPVMGAEGVAVHVADRWFFPGKVTMYSETDLLNAKVFAEFNRQSLIGSRAPELTLSAMDGSPVTLFSGQDKGGRFRVLYFYDADCARCTLESVLLRNLIDSEEFPVEVYAVYAGDDRKAWADYVRGKLGFEYVDVHHLWDPEFESDFQRKYGVLQTPRLFLIGPDGTVLGRGLDAEALYGMLKGIFAEVELDYGSEESEALFEGIFKSEGRPSAEDVSDVAGYIASSTIEKGDTVMFRQLCGDLLYYLAHQTDEGLKEGTGEFLDRYIFSKGKVWRSPDDSLKVMGLARMLEGLLSKSPAGQPVPSVKVPGECCRREKVTVGEYRLDRLKGRRNFILFYTEGCRNCDMQKAAARLLVSSDRKARVLMVNVDRIMEENPELAEVLMDSFDLSTLPFIVETDSKGVVRRRYVSLTE